MTMIWLCRYHTMENLSVLFNIPVSRIHWILHKFVKILHAYLVPKYIKLHSMNVWRHLAGIYPKWPTVVAIVDCTPFQISKPKGRARICDTCKYPAIFHVKKEFCAAGHSCHKKTFVLGAMQGLFYRGDCHCFFQNWLVIVDILGQIVLSRPGFIGKTSDSTCLQWVISENFYFCFFFWASFITSLKFLSCDLLVTYIYLCYHKD